MPQAIPAAAPTKSDVRQSAQKLDPLAAHIARLAPHPVPLIATHFDIEIKGALARVAATRRFRNAEDRSIEATITFPVPIGGVLHKLEADIGGRRLKAIAQPRKQARAAYEAALETGKTAVLHEELIPGIHMLSVGHIAPGTGIAVTATWAMIAGHAAGKTALRIPLTAGDVYGRSGLPDSDELVHRGAAQTATVTARFDSQALRINGTRLDDVGSPTSIGLDAPLDIEIIGLRSETLDGRFADGRSISLRIEPSAERDTPIEAALLLDHSSSMAEPASGAGPKASKHSAMLLGLSEAATSLRDGDKLDIWEFDNSVAEVGRAETPKQLRDLLTSLSPPSGGTEIGAALAAAAADGRRDVLLITDGKSHALDVHKLAHTGCRFTVVLVGEDSLEANAGRLAALTGGALFVAFGADIASAVAGAVASLRVAASEVGKAAETAHFRRSGMSIGLVAGKADEAVTRTDEQHAIAAFAAGLLMPSLTEAAACALALAEGLVSHLTSLVLIDAQGATADDIAAARKIALPSPRTMGSGPMASIAGSPPVSRSMARVRAFADYSLAAPSPAQTQPASAAGPRPAAPAAAAAPVVGGSSRSQAIDLFTLATTFPWGLRPQRLIEGDLSVLPREYADPIKQVANSAWLSVESKRLGIEPIALVIGLMARSLGNRDRMAARVARSVLKSADPAALDAIALRLGLPVARNKASDS